MRIKVASQTAMPLLSPSLFFSCLKDEASEGTEVKIKYP